MQTPLLIILILLSFCQTSNASRSFVVDYENDVFLKDGQPFRYISGTIHYFQVPRDLWRNRMEKARAMGVNVLQTYVGWNKHETYQGQYDFQGSSNITEYLHIADSLNLSVILRVGPYIDAEQDFGGFPYWLLKYPNITLRSSEDPRYLNAVKNWFSVLLPMIRPLLYVNGGPVIMIQVENEYGSYGCDKNYTTWLYNITVSYLQDQVVYFTTDGTDVRMIECGRIDGTLTTIDFGVSSERKVQSYFDLLRTFMPHGPLANSEFYPGWIDEWGQSSRSTKAASGVAETMVAMWNRNASFNIYPVHGGTNWGYSAGSEYPPFRSVTTEYDFDAPISEAGDITGKFLDLRKTVETLIDEPIQYPIPSNSTKFKTGKILLQYVGTIFDYLLTLTPPGALRQSVFPATMEQLDCPYGFVLYQTLLPASGRCLTIDGVRDGGHVIVDYESIHVIQRGYNDNVTEICPTKGFHQNSVLHLLIENQGRICYGYERPFNDPKGLVTNVTLDNRILTHWTMYPLDLNRFEDAALTKRRSSISQMPNPIARCSSDYLPSFYVGYFILDALADGFLNTTGWGKGQLFVNNIDIGRYWPIAGPQMSLYVPSVFLKTSSNRIVMFELDLPGNCDYNNCYVNFADFPIYT